jgi:hypothetical protein
MARSSSHDELDNRQIRDRCQLNYSRINDAQLGAQLRPMIFKLALGPFKEIRRLTPAERTGLENDLGSLEPGKLADVVLLAKDLKVHRTFIRGHELIW